MDLQKATQKQGVRTRRRTRPNYLTRQIGRHVINRCSMLAQQSMFLAILSNYFCWTATSAETGWMSWMFQAQASQASPLAAT